MKKRLNLLLFLALGAGTLAGPAAAQENTSTNAATPAQYPTFDASQAALQQVGWFNHRRCDGDHDRDDRNCYYRDRDGDRDDRYYNNGYYGSGYYNGYYGNPYGNRAAGWYDRNGYWHTYDRDRDRDRDRYHRHRDDDDDRR